jgi:hypothetical protein
VSEDVGSPTERGPDTFESWISLEPSAQGDPSEFMRRCSLRAGTFQILGSHHWDTAYMLAFLVYTLLEAVGDLLVSQNQT